MFNASDVLRVDQVQLREVDPFLAISISRMFIEYQLDIQGAAKGRMTEQHECRQQLADLD